MEKVFLKSMHIAGFSYYEGAFVFDKLKIGTILNIVAEEGNIHDEYAVLLKLDDKKVGYIPRQQNKEISKILKAKHDIFEAVIQQISPQEHPEKQVLVGIFIKPFEVKKK